MLSNKTSWPVFCNDGCCRTAHGQIISCATKAFKLKNTENMFTYLLDGKISEIVTKWKTLSGRWRISDRSRLMKFFFGHIQCGLKTILWLSPIPESESKSSFNISFSYSLIIMRYKASAFITICAKNSIPFSLNVVGVFTSAMYCCRCWIQNSDSIFNVFLDFIFSAYNLIFTAIYSLVQTNIFTTAHLFGFATKSEPDSFSIIYIFFLLHRSESFFIFKSFYLCCMSIRGLCHAEIQFSLTFFLCYITPNNSFLMIVFSVHKALFLTSFNTNVLQIYPWRSMFIYKHFCINSALLSQLSFVQLISFCDVTALLHTSAYERIFYHCLTVS